MQSKQTLPYIFQYDFSVLTEGIIVYFNILLNSF